MLLNRINQLKARTDYLDKLDTYIDTYLTDINIIASDIQNSNAIEGSTFTQGETVELLKDNTVSIEGKSVQEHLEVLGLKRAVDYLSENEGAQLDELDILEMHERIVKAHRPDIAGKYRLEPSYTYVETMPGVCKKHYYLDHTHVLSEMHKLLNRDVQTVEDILMFKLDFAQIHPFTDGNGRVSRLILNWLLMMNDYPPIIIKGATPEERKVYITAMADYSVNRNPEKFRSIVEQEVLSVMESLYT